LLKTTILFSLDQFLVEKHTIIDFLL